MRTSVVVVVVLQLLLAGAIARRGGVALDVGYYAATCPDAPATVRQAMELQFYNDRTIAPAIIRTLFHDCFVRVRATVHGRLHLKLYVRVQLLIVVTDQCMHAGVRRVGDDRAGGGRSSERVAIPNQTLRGFNRIKKVLEAACPGVVSCADTLALMARDSVVLLGGAAYGVPLGRRDGMQSNPRWCSSAATPSALRAVHFRYRLAHPDGTMDEPLRREMAGACGLADDPTAFLDPDTPFAIDNACYGQMIGNRSLLQLDQEAATHPARAGYVAYYAASPDAFMRRFSEAMAKLAAVGVLEGDAGEVRKVCSASAYNK
ncbi:class III peroxidase 52 precursor [Hordeum vulgare]|nr:class III peroxidase 52 precursor [Hordeum vulgare]